MIKIVASGMAGEITIVLPLDEIPDIQPGNFDIVRAVEQRLATIYEIVFGNATLKTVQTELVTREDVELALVKLETVKDPVIGERGFIFRIQASSDGGETWKPLPTTHFDETGYATRIQTGKGRAPIAIVPISLFDFSSVDIKSAQFSPPPRFGSQEKSQALYSGRGKPDLMILINNANFGVDRKPPHATGSEIKCMPLGYDASGHDLWLRGPGRGKDLKIADGEVIILEHGMEFFTAPKANSG